MGALRVDNVQRGMLAFATACIVCWCFGGGLHIVHKSQLSHHSPRLSNPAQKMHWSLQVGNLLQPSLPIHIGVLLVHAGKQALNCRKRRLIMRNLKLPWTPG